MVKGGDGRLRSSGTGTIGYRQGFNQDEFEERHQASGAGRRTFRFIQMGRSSHWLEKCSQRSRFFYGWAPLGDTWV